MTMAITKAVEEGGEGGHLRLHRQHQRLRRRLRRPRRADLRRARAAGQDRAWASWPRRWCTAPSCCRSRATSTTACALASKLADRLPGAPGQLRQPVPHGGPEDRRRSRSSTRSATRPTSTACRSATPATSPPTGWATASTPTTGTGQPRTPRMFGFQAAGAAPIVTGAGGRAPEHDRHRDPHRQPGLLDQGAGRPGRVRRPHRRGDRPRDPGRVPAAGPQRGRVRRAGLGGQRRRPAAGRRGRRARAGPAGGLHGHRQRPQGPGVGDLRRPRAGRPSRSTPAAAAGAARPSDRSRARRSGSRAGHQRQPRPGFDCAGLALACTTTSSSPSPTAGLDVEVDRRGRRRAAHRTSRTSSCARSARPSPSWAGRRPGCALRRRNGIPQARGLGLVGGGDRRRGRRGLGAVPGRRGASTTTPSLRLATELEGHPDNVAACLLGGADLSLDRAGGRPRGPARRRTRVRAGRVRARPRRCPPTSPAGCCPTSVPHADAALNAGRGGAAGARADPRAGAAARRPPRTGCTSTTARRRCRTARAGATGCARAGRRRRRLRRRAEPCSCCSPAAPTTARPRPAVADARSGGLDGARRWTSIATGARVLTGEPAGIVSVTRNTLEPDRCCRAS